MLGFLTGWGKGLYFSQCLVWSLSTQLCTGNGVGRATHRLEMFGV